MLETEKISEKSDSGWLASLQLGFELRNQRTVMVRNAHRGPLRVLRPFYPEENYHGRNHYAEFAGVGPGLSRNDQDKRSGVCHTYVLHPPGGMVGGDRITIDVTCAAGAEALITTPSAGRVYWNNRECLPQVQTVNIEVAAGAYCEWLPQENILFDGAWANNRVTVNLAEDAHYAGWEVTCLGRPAASESFTVGQLDQQLQIYREGKPLLLERGRMMGGSAQLQAQWGLQGYPVFGALVVTVSDTKAGKALVEELRAVLDIRVDAVNTNSLKPRLIAAVSALPELLVVRALAESATTMRELFIELWRKLRRSQRGREAAAPRIWFT